MEIGTTTSDAGVTPEFIADFGQRYLAAWNSHEPERLLALMTGDIEYRDDARPQVMRGHADVREFLEHLWRAFPDLRFDVLEGPYLVTGEPKAAWWWRGEGTMTGPLDPPGFAPTRKRFQVDGVDFHEYRDGKLAHLRIAFNLADASQQLGLLPAAGGRAEQLVATVQRLSRRVRR